MAHDVFVSYSSKDKPTADAVCAVLESHGIRCWVAPRDILPGIDWGASIIEAIHGARAMVLVFSANANASLQIKREVERAINKGIPVIPLRIEDVVPTASLEYFLSTPHWLDAFAPPLERHLQYLAEVVRKLVGGPEVSIPLPVSESESRERSQTKTTQSQPAIPPVASISAIAGSKEPSVWIRKRLIKVAAGAVATLLLLTVAVLLVRPRSIDSSAERDYAEGVKLVSGFGLTKINEPKAAECFERAAAKNLPEAEAGLAIWSKNGFAGRATDNVKAQQLAKKALEDGLTLRARHNVQAQEQLANLYYYGLGVSKDETKAAELYQKAADQGYAAAQINLGSLYVNGTGVTKDVGKAAELFQKAADQGLAMGQALLGLLYTNGTGVAKDVEKAAELYQKAADQGLAQAQNALGFCYANGTGVAKDVGKAAELFQKATDQGNADGQTNLGLFCEYGRGVPKDVGKAAELFQKAADQGSARGQNALGFAYNEGIGVSKDVAKAVELFQKAANQGNADAIANLKRLSENKGATGDRQ
jgi:TPR repeat protein